MGVLDRRGNLKVRRLAGSMVTLLRRGPRTQQDIKNHLNSSETMFKRARDTLLDMKLLKRAPHTSRGYAWELTQRCLDSLENGGTVDDLIGLADRSYGSALWGAVNNLDDRLSIIEAILSDDMGDPVWLNLLNAAQHFTEDMSDENLADLEGAIESIVPSSSRPTDNHNPPDQTEG